MPPKKNKKPSRNGYWEFVMECRDKQKNRNMDEIQTYASQKWANMSRDERGPYENRALLARDTFRTGRLTTDGLEIDEVERAEKETFTKIHQMKADISRMIKSASFAMNLESQVFLLIHINHLVYIPAEDRYFICEVAITALSLKNGVEATYHSFVKPGKITLGFYGTAKAHSQETHQLLDIIHQEPYEDNTEEVFEEMMNFMRGHTNSGSPIIVYTDEKTIDMTKKVINTFLQDFNYREEIRVYRIEFLFLSLRNTVAGDTVWSSETFSHNALDRDLYACSPDIACEYHETYDISNYCSKSIVTKNAFTICDHCCGDLKIALLPGKHVPTKAKVPVESRTVSKAPSVCSSDDSRSVSRTRGESVGSAAAFDENFPPLGSNRSTASSVVSFSSLKGAASTSKTATRLEQSFKALSLKQAATNHADLKLPERGANRK